MFNRIIGRVILILHLGTRQFTRCLSQPTGGAKHSEVPAVLKSEYKRFIFPDFRRCVE